MGFEGFELPKGWRWAPLGEVLAQRNDVIHPRNRPTGVRTYVGLEHIESHTGRRIGSLEIDLSRMTGRRAAFTKGDIVYGYLRPYLNKVWVAEFNGLCSVDQYVFRTNDEIADRDYVATYMRSEVYLSLAPVTATPGQLPRIRTEEVAATLIPIPRDVDEQRRIVAALAERRITLDAARRAAEAQLADSERLRLRGAEALPIPGPLSRLSDVVRIDSDLVDPTSAEHRNLPHISGENIEAETGILSSYRTATEDKVTSPKFKFDAGDVLYSKLRPYLRKVAIAPRAGVCSADMYPLKTDSTRLLPEFLALELLSERFSRYAIQESARSRMPKLNREALFAWEMPLPPIEDQSNFVSKVAGVRAAVDVFRTNAEAQLAELSALEPALLRAAFSGAL